MMQRIRAALIRRILPFFGIVEFSRILRKVQVSRKVFVPIFILSVLIGVFDSLSMALLIPFLRGMISASQNLSLTVPGFLIVDPVTIQFNLNDSIHSVYLLLAFIFLMVLLKQLAQFVSARLNASQILRFQTELRKELFERFLCFGKLYFDRNHLGSISSALTTFVNDTALLWTHLLTAFNATVFIFCYLAIALLISWKFTVFTFVILPPLYYSVKYISKKIQKLSLQQARLETDLAQASSEMILSIPLIKSYSMEKRAKSQFGKLSDRLFQLRYELTRRVDMVAPVQEIISSGALLFIVGVCFALVKRGTHDVSGFLVFFVVIRRLIGQGMTLNALRGRFSHLQGQMDRLAQVFVDEDKHFVKGGEKTFHGLKNSIEFINVGFEYCKNRPVLRRLNLSIEAGKMTAIVGPTGSGKSTIMNLLIRFYEYNEGRILLDGMNLRDFSLLSLRRRVALVSQDTVLLNASILKNLTYGLERRVEREELFEVCRQAQLEEFISSLSLGFETHIGDRGLLLSGGERQRIAIARALLKRADILLLDEATSALDSATENQISIAIQNAVKGRTAIVIAHRLATIQGADKIIVLEAGRDIESGTLNELLGKEGRFKFYWLEQNRYMEGTKIFQVAC